MGVFSNILRVSLSYLFLYMVGRLRRIIADDFSYNGSTWMADLPQCLHSVPLKDLAIPGSHNSGTYSLKKEGEIAPDQKNELKLLLEAAQKTNWAMEFTKDVIYRWSVTQDLSITDQLNLGIRYLDLRIAYNEKDKSLYVVHGLYGSSLNNILKQIKDFVTENTKEVVIVDINHFYHINQAIYNKMEYLIIVALGKYLIPRQPVQNVSLQSAWKNGANIIVIAGQKDMHLRYANQFWTSDSIVAPFSSSDSQSTSLWLKRLKSNYNKERPGNKFYVTQGIMVPNWLDITTGGLFSNGSLRVKSKVASQRLVEWLKDEQTGTQGINIVTADFIETEEFVRSVLALNSGYRTCNVCNLLLLVLLLLSSLNRYFWCT